MRAMESVVKSLGVKLNVTVVDKDNVDLEWGKILGNLKTPIEAMPKGREKEDWSAANLFVNCRNIALTCSIRPEKSRSSSIGLDGLNRRRAEASASPHC